MTFEQAVEIILGLEGGYVNDPLDPGSETHWGISKRSFPDEDIKKLTRERAVEIYRHAYWEKLKLDMMPEPIRLPFFDCAVNQGPGTATVWLQRTIGVKTDAILGMLTLATLAASDIEQVRKEFILRRMRGYIEAKGWPRYGAGWAMRIMKVVLA